MLFLVEHQVMYSFLKKTEGVSQQPQFIEKNKIQKRNHCVSFLHCKCTYFF